MMPKCQRLAFLLVSLLFHETVSLEPKQSEKQAAEILPQLVGILSIPVPGYVEVIHDHPNEPSILDQYTLFLSTFNPINFNVDPKYYLRSPGRVFNETPESDWALVQLDKTAYWPNSPEPMPLGVFPEGDVQGIVWTSGFLVPGKKKGKLELYDTTKSPIVGPLNIAATDSKDWSYHRVLWKDMDFDGDLDALVPRFHVGPLGGTEQSMVYFENPGLPFNDTTNNGEGWAQHEIISDGPDVHIASLELNGIDIIVGANFWNEEAIVYYTQSGDWRNASNIQQIVLDNSPGLGRAFDVHVYDLNGDEWPEIIVTAFNHTFGNVWVWEIPREFPEGNFIQHRIASGFEPNSVAGGEAMTPGSPKTFWPSAEAKRLKERPYIMLSGDDDGKHYILTADSEDPNDWSYTKHVLVDTAAPTVGKFSIVDLDGDGWNEIIVAGYSADKLYVFSYGNGWNSVESE